MSVCVSERECVCVNAYVHVNACACVRVRVCVVVRVRVFEVYVYTCCVLVRYASVREMQDKRCDRTDTHTCICMPAPITM